jgi:hypothetical protein
MTRSSDITVLMNMLSPDDLVGDDLANYTAAKLCYLLHGHTLEHAEAMAMEFALEAWLREVGV